MTEEIKTESPVFAPPTCGKGWAIRCAFAKSPTCRCKCGGRNHGNKEAQPAGKKYLAAPEFVPEYVGKIVGLRAFTEQRVFVFYDGHLLDPAASLEVVNHSPTGFEWGYLGSGCAQLALAICLKYLTRAEAEIYYQQFKFDVIQALPRNGFELDLETVKYKLNKLAA